MNFQDMLSSNPQMMSAAQQMMQDPEMMRLMQQPGMMERMQAAMANPASIGSDPEVMRIFSRFQNSLNSGGGVVSNSPPPSSSAVASSASNPNAPKPDAHNITHLTTLTQLQAVLQTDKLVVVDYFTHWCGPCKAIAPVFTELAAAYKTVVFVKVDGDQARDLCMSQGVQGFPTFHFYLNGSRFEAFSGADAAKLRRIVEAHADNTPLPPPCTYKHFPLKDAETVKYQDIKWEMVESKYKEINDKLRDEGKEGVLPDADVKEIENIINTLKNKASYHNTPITPAQISIVKKLLTWSSDHLGPVLNLLRMIVFHPDAAKLLAQDVESSRENNVLMSLINLIHTTSKPTLSLLAVRALCNMFNRRILVRSGMSPLNEQVLESVGIAYKKYDDDNLRLSIIGLYINYSILFREDAQFYNSGKVLMLTSLQEILQSSPFDTRKVYRALVVAGTLLYNDKQLREMATDLQLQDDIAAILNDQQCKSDKTIVEAIQEIREELRK